MRTIIVVALLAPSVVQAATLEVGPSRTYKRIQTAIDAARDGDVILVDAGSYREELDIDKDLVVRGAGRDATRVWNSGNGTLVRIDGATVTLEALTLDDAERGLDVTDATVDVRDVLVKQMDRDGDGAGARVRDASTVSLTDVSFDDTKANGARGGAIYLENSDLSATGVEIRKGDAQRGGGIYVAGGGALVLASSALVDNQSDRDGAGVHVAPGGEATITGTELVGNAAGGRGGGLYAELGTVSVSGASFWKNRATEGGGVALRDVAGATISRSVLCANEARSGGGGGAWAQGVSGAAWRNDVFAENTASTQGGGLYHAFGAPPVVGNNTFVGNRANQQGGGAWFSGVKFTFTNNIVAVTPAGNGVSSDAAAAVGASLTYGDWFDNRASNLGASLASFALPVGNLLSDPELLAWSANGDCGDDRFTPRWGSPVIDAGDPALKDPDGSRSDIGAFGGPGVDAAWFTDADGDGYLAVYDCDDASAAVRPGAAEVCDGVDDDCDGLADDADPDVDTSTFSTFFEDADADGYGAPGSTVEACAAPPGYGAGDGDCDDAAKAVHPGAAEVCNGVDDDCSGVADGADAADAGTYYADADGDGYGDAGVAVSSCGAPTGFVALAGDCDDASATTSPGAKELCNGADDDCDGTTDEPTAADAGTWYVDADGDGYGGGPALVACAAPPGTVAEGGDCDDADPLSSPSAVEWCDGADNDCDGATDEEAADAATWYLDGDGDGWGDDAKTRVACAQPAGHVAAGGDCDDASAAHHPYAIESCADAIDRNCDGSVGDADADGDGTRACEDCDDADPGVNPGATEVCDGKDDDCDAKVDEADAVGASLWYADADGDGYGDADASVLACDAPSRYVADDSDCDDTLPSVHPGAAESCSDIVDRNCDGSVGEVDHDGDGFFACEECDDGDAGVNPDAAEVCDGVDDDCDGAVDDADPDAAGSTWYVDADGDGYGASTSVSACEQPPGTAPEGGDCDDGDALVYPGALEVPHDGVDEDCDGLDGDDVIDTGEEEVRGRGCRCDSGASPPGFLAALLALVGLRRRRTVGSMTGR